MGSRPAGALLTAVMLTSCTNAASTAMEAMTPHELARVAAERFLARYVGPDGSVTRTDQGSDVVSEGQSYALVLAQVAEDQVVFDLVWRWTEANLIRPDGLLAGHADRDGTILDPNSAADADVVTAWALLRDAGPNADEHHAAGRRLADSVLEHETLTLDDGTLVLAAGNWATGSPGTLNPSYWAIPVLADLARLTGDARWSQLAASSIRLVSSLTADGRQLPPDWARVDGSAVTATPAPSGQAPDVRYSLDAQRVVAWFAVGGDQAAPLAADWSSLLEAGDRSGAMALSPDGTVLDGNTHPVPLVAAAAAAAASGEPGTRDRLLSEAEALDGSQPTYYGGAWVALGRALLTTDLLGPGQP